MKIKLNKKRVKNLSKTSSELAAKQTAEVGGGNFETYGMCSYGCDTAVYLGCVTGRDCYSFDGLCHNPN
ncbi:MULTISPECIES: hypothetical protein [Pseudoalteromonas]|uniref:Uncharacterized protein n=1 Tax=Pseudoalteromonas luteoviolacea (strain 2ta16) TaxID=1353533 RepID=V4HVK4_PSEL2|nr:MULTISPECIES: hypothetical protein [Pseudoalteromonas]ESP91984.1 hypothetical protein PL2TA16_05120 [Pseudoalteromonas luteoviolacea 2ta16]KZN32539.1 hypothetical protein N483_27050 [Pseudoalteromonas luteoviolacea NCIMB 1944]MCG7551224.1 hypothetical protein [Pseudoalteromonas sp. Of7M-16]